ncbi:hypothetical protein ABI59_11260 [Acidobacteria bacterium Mor1]|nr:hypothetical protein ABI59_11260 [Acidobacteria bacterium Mor1]
MKQAPTDETTERFAAGDPEVVAAAADLVREAVRFKGFYIPAQDQPEVIQETLTDLWRSLRAGKSNANPRNFEAYVRTIAYRRCVDWMRSRRPQEELSVDVPDAMGDAEHRALAAERVRIGARVLESLSPACRTLIAAHTVDQRTYADIAAEQGRLEKTVRNQMYKCLKSARSILDRMLKREKLGLRAKDPS